MKLFTTLLMACCLCITASAIPPADTSLATHFPGGTAAFSAILNTNLRYPEKAATEKIEGDLVFSATLTTEGKLANIQPIAGIQDKAVVWEAMRLLMIPQGWVPYTANEEIHFCVNFSLAGNKPAVKVSFNVQPPAFPGGNEKLYAFLGNNIKYPKKAKDYDGKKYIVYVNFVVDEQGKLADVHTGGTKRGDYGFEEAALKMVNKMPRWQPCLVDGQPKAVKFMLPVHFVLP